MERSTVGVLGNSGRPCRTALGLGAGADDTNIDASIERRTDGSLDEVTVSDSQPARVVVCSAEEPVAGKSGFLAALGLAGLARFSQVSGLHRGARAVWAAAGDSKTGERRRLGGFRNGVSGSSPSGSARRSRARGMEATCPGNRVELPPFPGRHTSMSTHGPITELKETPIDRDERAQLRAQRPSFRWSDLGRAPLHDFPIRDEILLSYFPLSGEMEMLEIGP